MGSFETAKGKWSQFQQKAGPVCHKVRNVLQKIGSGIGIFCSWVYKLRGVVMAVPVAWAAIRLAIRNNELLPESLGIFIQSNGSYAMNITHQAAVYFPLAVTGLCILLMFCTKKPLYPWLVSILTLIIPLFMMLSVLMPG